MKTARLLICGCAGLLGIGVHVGCRQQSAVTQPAATTVSASAADFSAEELPLAVDSLRKLAGGVSPESLKRTYFYFNQWIASYEPAKAPWQPDKLIERLPQALKQTPGLERLAKNRFEKENLDSLLATLSPPPGLPPEVEKQYREHLPQLVVGMQDTLWLNDLAYFQQTLWLHDITSRVASQPPPAELKSWLKKIETSAGLPEAEQLAAAERLFDWTIRNLQLDPLPPAPKAVATADPSGEKRPPLAPSQQGQLGPGYGHVPLQSLLYGHADAHERARIFIQLCRQAGIDAVMLGLNDESSPTPRPWLPAAFIGGKLYLFDTALSLPLPGSDDGSIASLDEVVAQPQLLERLNVPGQPPYPVGPKDLQAVLALIDAEPAALSRRMQLLQVALPRTSRLILAVQPSQLEARLRKSPHTKQISSVSLWRVPLDAILYQVGRLSSMARDREAAAQFDLEQNLFYRGRLLLPARNLHLQGRLQDVENERGAWSIYLQCRVPNREIQALKTSSFFRATQGLIDNPDVKADDREAQLDWITKLVLAEKQHATYWLGLSYYEQGGLDTTLLFLGKHIINVSPPSRFDAGARYNLARCYEDLGRYALARQWLESDTDSPQRTGNLLRARWLAQKHPEAEPAAAAAANN